MSASSTPRPDITYLRRRSKPGPAPAAQSAATVAVQSAAPAAAAPSLSLSRPAAPPSHSQPLNLAPAQTRATAPPSQPGSPSAAQASGQPSAGLVLGGAAPASHLSGRAKKLAQQREKAKREDHEVQLLFPAPGISDVFELNLTDRLLRLSPLQSAVGTLVVTGSTAVAWESVRRVTGGQTVDGHKAGTSVMTTGNRPLVGYHGRDALLTLRHVRQFRRAIFINRSSSAMGVRLISGHSVALPPAADGAQMVLLVHRVGNVLELRAEPIPQSWPDIQIWQEFDFSMTHSAPASSYGR
ncbi:hypothetical protein ART_2678 [Arthrobacter sp. PAMC 25486]|uniref:hypothetical protein n=1 Tax=Arthrobacter sp. PAMC 25486 TaxID=1494608 RepID=UPI000535C54B|nr:hypothetical protein [Arthrobacter sp. PAMC 25486]AIY02277.1 hypothetical protein ART_2678 [Arthrobacter sp. PAMC 25486]